MAINSTSSATSATTSPTTTSATGSTLSAGLGQGSVIDVNGLVAKMDSIEQAPIDKLNVNVAAEDQAITDLGTIKSKMSLFQAALQDFTDPVSYLNKTIASSNTAAVDAAISNSTAVNPGIYSIHVDSVAQTSTVAYEFALDASGNLSSSGQFTLKTTLLGGAAKSGVTPAVIHFNAGDSLETLRASINSSSSATGVIAAIINTGSKRALSLTSSVGGKDSQVLLTPDAGTISGLIVQGGGQAGADAVFTVNGQSFTRTSNVVEDALPGVKLQLLKNNSDVAISVSSSNTDKAQTLITNLGQAFNDLITSYNDLSKFSPDATKRGSLYGFPDLRTLIDSASLSFMSALTRGTDASGNPKPILDNTGNPISFTTLGLELQLDGTLLFDPSIFQSAVNHGAIDQIANGTISPTRSLITDAMTYGGKVDSFISSFEDKKSTLQNRIQDLQTRKADKMARYRAQYAALDALLYRLQALNSSLTPTFTALNNPKN
jgi:flagellar hook-associated protein 2